MNSSRWNKNVEDGMGFAGLIPDKNEHNYVANRTKIGGEMNLADKPCYPTYRIITNQLGMPMVESIQDGLSFRERLIGQAMQGILSNPALLDVHGEKSMSWVTEHAILQADYVLTELKNKLEEK